MCECTCLFISLSVKFYLFTFHIHNAFKTLLHLIYSLFHCFITCPAGPAAPFPHRRKYRIGRDGIIAMAAAKSAAMIIGENKKWDNSASRKLAPSRGKMQAGGRKQCISARP